MKPSLPALPRQSENSVSQEITTSTGQTMDGSTQWGLHPGDPEHQNAGEAFIHIESSESHTDTDMVWKCPSLLEQVAVLKK